MPHKFSVEMMKATPKAYGLSEEKMKKLPEFAFESMKQVNGMSMVFGVGKSGESLYANMIAIMRVNDVKAYMAAYEKDLKQYADFVKAADVPALQPIEVEPSDFGGAHALQITITAPKFPEGQQAPMPSQKMMEHFFGPEGKVTGWIVPVDEHSVVLGYVNKELLQQTIDALKQGKPVLAGNAEIAKTAAMLPPDAVTVGYLSPQGTIEFVKQTVLAAIPFVGNLKDDLPEFPRNVSDRVRHQRGPQRGAKDLRHPGRHSPGHCSVRRKGSGGPQRCDNHCPSHEGAAQNALTADFCICRSRRKSIESTLLALVFRGLLTVR